MVTPTCWTHPLVWLPSSLAALLLCGFLLVAVGGAFATAAAAVLLFIAVLLCSVVLVLWLLGCACCRDEGFKPSAASTQPEPFHADVLRLPGGGGEVAMSYAPGRQRKQHQRNLQDDVSSVRRDYQVDVVVTLLEQRELDVMNCHHMMESVEQEGMVWHHFQVRDKWVPWNSSAYVQEVVMPLLQRLRSGQRILVHCNGGKGRTGTLVAALLMTSLGGNMSLQAALSAMRAVRPGMLKNPLQQLFLLHLKSTLNSI